MQIPGVHLLGEIGRGGFGVVWKGQTADGRLVAVKLVHRLRGERVLQRFERERRLLLELGEEKGFVPVLAAGESAKGPYLVMPFVAGGTLRERLNRGPLSIAETLGLGRALATALGHAHALGIVHRDLKPENVLFTAEGRPLVADLGLAKHYDKDAAGAADSIALSKTGDVLGSAGYVAPEQLANARDVGPPADVFALGAILHECLSGAPAFEADSQIALFAKIASGKFEPLAPLCPDAPGWLVATVERALALDPARRFEDGHALARALVAPEPVARTGGGALLGALAALVVLGISGGAYALLRPPASSGPVDGRTAPPSPGAPPAKDFVPERTRRAREVAESAARRYYAQDLTGAIDEATAAIELDERVVRAWIVRGRARLEGIDARAGREDVEHALELEPRNGEALCWLAEAKRRAGDAEGAFACANDAVNADPGYARSYLVRGMLHDAAGRVAEAMADYDAAIAGSPRDGLAYLLRATAFGGQRRYPESIRDATFAILYAPREAQAWAMRARVRYEVGDVDNAGLDAERAIELDPRLARPYVVRANVRLMAGDTKRGLLDYDRAIELDPSFGWSYYSRGLAFRTLGRLDAARADLEKAVAIEGNPAARVDLADVLGRLGKNDEAEADLLRVARERPQLLALWTTLARVRLDRSDPSGALAAAQKGIELSPDSTWSWYYAGLAHQRLGALDEAEACYGHALDKEPRFWNALLDRARVRADAGKSALALDDARRLVEHSPDDARTWWDASTIKERMKLWKEAADDMARSVALDGRNVTRVGNWGRLLSSAGEHEAAIAVDTLAISLSPAEAWLYWNRAVSRRAQGDLDGAHADLTTAARLAPDQVKPWGDRALLLIAKRDRVAARADFDRAFAIDPKATFYVTQRAYNLYDMRLYSEAATALDHVLEIDPKNANAFRVRGNARARLGKKRAALEDFDRAIALDPKSALFHRERARLRHDLGLTELVLEDAVALLAMPAGESYGWFFTGLAHAAKKDRPAAEKACANLLATTQWSSWTRSWCAEVYRDLGSFDRAVAETTLAIAGNPRDTVSIWMRGEARFALGDLDGALADADLVVAIDPAPFRSLVLRARVLRAKKDRSGARAALDRAVTEDPTNVPAWRERASLRAEEGDVAGAVADLERALEYGADLPGADALRAELSRLKNG